MADLVFETNTKILVVRSITLFFVLCFCSAPSLFAQSLELSIPSEQLPSDISLWDKDPGLLRVTLIAPDAIELDEAHIVFQATEGVEHILISSRDRFASQPSFSGKFKKKTFLLKDFVDLDSISIDPSFRSTEFPLGKLPGGLFSFCIYLVDSSGKQIENVAQGCSNFSVRDIDSPHLLAPANEELHSTKSPLAFSWTAANVLSQTIHYQLKVYPFYEGQTPNQAMSSSSALYTSDDIFSTTFIYPADGPPLTTIPKIKGFTWIVTQFDQNDKAIGKNYGRSVPSVFYVRKD